VIVIGALERLWSLHEEAWADYSRATGDRPDHPLRESVLSAHEAITDAIADGDAALAHERAASHLALTQPQVLEHRQSQRIYITNTEANHRLSANGRSAETL